ncbi:MAG: hypothetical protein IPK31_14330 [Chitinophagaceae bacterium]|nr:hypothetical protein [Chitinophagaceae bacterium]
MRYKLFFQTFFFSLAIAWVTGCTKDTVTESYTFFQPVYKTKAEVKAEAKSGPAISVNNPGKLFVRGSYAFLSELDKGVHIIDFSNPAAPRNIAFVNIPGCVDLAVRGNYLYADCYTDLVTIDISDPQNVVVKQFIEGVFPHRMYSNGFSPDTSKIITSWVRVDTVVKRRMDDVPVFINTRRDIMVFANMSGTSVNNSAVTNGTGGSMARFALMGERLYTVSWSDLKVFNTSNAALPAYVKTVTFSQGNIETVFPYKDKLFIGSQTGMFIYNASNPDSPIKLGQFTHARVCDPVIADDHNAFVTLRSNSACAGFLNQLDVLDINNLTSPSLIKSYQLKEPAGLSKDGNLLLICDGKDGLKFFDATNVNSLVQIKQISGMETYDVIALGGLAITVAKDGLYFINYSNPANAAVVGKISIIK